MYINQILAGLELGTPETQRYYMSAHTVHFYTEHLK